MFLMKTTFASSGMFWSRCLAERLTPCFFSSLSRRWKWAHRDFPPLKAPVSPWISLSLFFPFFLSLFLFSFENRSAFLCYISHFLFDLLSSPHLLYDAKNRSPGIGGCLQLALTAKRRGSAEPKHTFKHHYFNVRANIA